MKPKSFSLGNLRVARINSTPVATESPGMLKEEGERTMEYVSINGTYYPSIESAPWQIRGSLVEVKDRQPEYKPQPKPSGIVPSAANSSPQPSANGKHSGPRRIARMQPSASNNAMRRPWPWPSGYGWWLGSTKSGRCSTVARLSVSANRGQNQICLAVNYIRNASMAVVMVSRSV